MSATGFCWYELMADDVDAAAAFYASVVGWDTRDGMPEGAPRYVVAAAPTGRVAGIMALPPHVRAAGGRSHWTGYIATADVDAAASAVAADGGKVHLPPTDIPQVGRFSVVADPQGGHFVLFTPAVPGDTQTAWGMSPGQCGWNEYFPTDVDGALAFYGRHFGWTKDQAIDMGPMGVYQLFSIGEAYAHGGMMRKPPEMPFPAWQFYFNVEALDDATRRATDAGGKVEMGPMEVPGGMWVAVMTDPQGAYFGLLAPKR